ncbi:hypothetical protein [Microbacterium sp. NPDC057650]|uniref:hypothetical protein n=1 Tax=unclassified Microbacterium TaxID=2609290 RepID=UPI00366FD1EA
MAETDLTAEPDYAVLRVSSIAEVYVDELLNELTSRYLKGTSDFEISVADMVSTQFRQSWPERRKWLSNSFGISLAGTAIEQDFQLVIDLRNAIAHGGGRMTFNQRKDLSKQLALQDSLMRRLGTDCDGDRIVCTATTITSAIHITSQYIRELDAAATGHN